MTQKRSTSSTKASRETASLTLLQVIPGAYWSLVIIVLESVDETHLASTVYVTAHPRFQIVQDLSLFKSLYLLRVLFVVKSVLLVFHHQLLVSLVLE